MHTEIPRFFMGTSTKNGFYGFPRDYYETDPAAHAFLIKSGPGTGKSTLLRGVAADFRKTGETVEEILCSSDPDSLDGIYFPARRVCVFDATAPHILEPREWGLKEEIISLGDALDTEALVKQREEIARATAQNTAAHARARRLLAGVSELFADRVTLSETALNPSAVSHIAARLAETELKKPATPCALTGTQRRFLSAVTPKGLLTCFDTPAALCPRVILLDDPFFAAVSALLEQLKSAAERRGLPAILCPHPLSPDRIAHLLLPSAGVAFVSAEKGGEAFSPTRKLHLKRCYEQAALNTNKNRTAFEKKCEHALLSAAVEALAEAKKTHDFIEIPYKSAMNFKKANKAKAALYQRISAFLPQA